MPGTRGQHALCLGALAGLVVAGDGGRTAVITPRGQARHDAGDVGHRAVLAELGLGLDPDDLQLQADDGAQLAFDERAWRVVHRPGRRLARRGQPGRLVLGRQAPDDVLDPVRVVVHYEPAVDVRRDVVPGRDDPAVLPLRGVPGRRDVGVRAAHDGQRFTQSRLAPLVVVAGHMTVEGALPA